MRTLPSTALLALLTACNPNRWSPFALDTEGLPRYDRRESELRASASLGFSPSPARVGLIADTHLAHRDLRSVLRRIQGLGNLDFVACAGDVTNRGTKSEYAMFLDSMQRLALPWFLAIGNHDHLSRGRTLFEAIFGPTNHIVSHAGTKYIFWDSISFEHGRQIPYRAWLERALSGEEPKILVTHISPLDADAWTGFQSTTLLDILERGAVKAVVHGHGHDQGLVTVRGIPLFQVGSVAGEDYGILEVEASGAVHISGCQGASCVALY